MESSQNERPQCAISFVLNLVGGKWKIPIIWALAEGGSLRYNELKRQVPGVSNIMLTRCLTELGEFGLISRQEVSRTPLHVEYALTDLGRALIPSLSLLVDWGSLWKEEAARRGLEPPEDST